MISGGRNAVRFRGRDCRRFTDKKYYLRQSADRRQVPGPSIRPRAVELGLCGQVAVFILVCWPACDAAGNVETCHMQFLGKKKRTTSPAVLDHEISSSVKHRSPRFPGKSNHPAGETSLHLRGTFCELEIVIDTRATNVDRPGYQRPSSSRSAVLKSGIMVYVGRSQCILQGVLIDCRSKEASAPTHRFVGKDCRQTCFARDCCFGGSGGI